MDTEPSLPLEPRSFSRVRRRQLLAQTLTSLGETVEERSLPWWHFRQVIDALGEAKTIALAAQAIAILAAPVPGEGLPAFVIERKEGGRRTAGGVFFKLAKMSLGRERWRRARWFAIECAGKTAISSGAA